MTHRRTEKERQLADVKGVGGGGVGGGGAKSFGRKKAWSEKGGVLVVEEIKPGPLQICQYSMGITLLTLFFRMP